MNWPLVFFAYGGLAALIDNARGPIFPDLLQELGLSNTRGALFFLVTSAAAIPAGFLIQKLLRQVGSLCSFRIVLMAMGIGALLMGLSRTANELFAASFVFGIGLAGCGLTVNLLIKEAASEERQRAMQSGLHSVYGAFSFLAPMLVSLLYGFQLVWQECFVILSLIPILLCLATIVIKVESTSHGDDHRRWRDVENKKYVLLFCGIMATYVSSELLISSRLVQLLRTDLNYSLDGANAQLSLFFLLLMFGRLLMTFSLKSLSSKSVLYGSSVLTIILLLAGLRGSPFLIALTGLSMSVFFPVAVSELFRKCPRDSSTALSLVFVVLGICMLTVHLAMGYFSDIWSVGHAFYIAPFLMLLCFVLLKIKYKYFSDNLRH